MRHAQMDMSYDDGIVERDVARQKLRTDQRRIQYARGKAGLLETQRWTTNPFPLSNIGDNELDRANRVAAYERYIDRIKARRAEEMRLIQQDGRATHEHQPGQTGYLPCR